MWIQFCKSKLAHGHITETELFYEGSVTIDSDLIEAAGLIPGEKVEVLNLNNGCRLETYVIAGKPGSGQICLNGPAARCGYVGDRVIILSYALMEPQEARNTKTRVVYLNEHNRITEKETV